MNGKPFLLKLIERVALIWCVISATSFAACFLWPTPPPSVAVVKGIVLASLALCILHAAASKGWRKALAFSTVSFVISWIVEFIGCNYGWWFGDYGYTPVLGYAVGGVPLLVVFAWETGIYPSHLLADEFIGPSSSPYRVVRLLSILAASLATALVTTTWDTMTDPVSVLQNFWTWDFGGAYMHEIKGGIPFSNYWGWIGAVFIISLLYRLAFSDKTNDSIASGPSIFATAQFSSLFFGAATSLMQHHLYLPCFIGTFTMGPIVILAWARLLAHARTVPSITVARAATIHTPITG